MVIQSPIANINDINVTKANENGVLTITKVKATCKEILDIEGLAKSPSNVDKKCWGDLRHIETRTDGSDEVTHQIVCDAADDNSF